MKRFITQLLSLSLPLVFSAAAVKAQVPAPGGSVTHNLKCSVPHDYEGHAVLGVGYFMQCKTQALEPKYNLKGCSLFSQVVAPNTEPTEIPLTIESQSSTQAFLKDSNGFIKVKITKHHLTAVVSFGDDITMGCAEVN